MDGAMVAPPDADPPTPGARPHQSSSSPSVGPTAPQRRLAGIRWTAWRTPRRIRASGASRRLSKVEKAHERRLKIKRGERERREGKLIDDAWPFEIDAFIQRGGPRFVRGGGERRSVRFSQRCIATCSDGKVAPVEGGESLTRPPRSSVRFLDEQPFAYPFVLLAVSLPRCRFQPWPRRWSPRGSQ